MSYATFEVFTLALLIGSTGLAIIGCSIIAILDRVD